MITFKKLTVCNFMSVGNRSVEFDLAKNNTTLVVGENGCGKSQCYTDAITYVLFNKSFRKINLPNLVNSINDNNCLVEIEFTSGRNEYLVRRGMKPGIFEIHKNGALVPQDAKAKDYQTMLEKNILGMNFRSFTQIVILGSASFTPFMQLQASHRREVIEEILEIQVFSTMHTILKGRISELKEQQRDLQYKIDLVEEKIKMNEAHQQKTLDDLKTRNVECESKIVDAEKKIAEYQQEIDDVNGKIQERQDAINDSDAVSAKTKEYERYQSKIRHNSSKISDETQFFHDNCTCPTCQQEIDPEFKSNAIKERNEKIDEYNTALVKLSDALEKLNDRAKAIDAEMKVIATLSAQTQSASNKMLAESQYVTKLRTDMANNELKIGKLSGEGFMSNGEREALESEKDVVTNKYDDVQKAMGYADVSYKLLKDTGIKTKIIRQYLPLINKLVNEYLAKLNFSVLFTLDEEFKESIKSRFRDNFSYESFSEGEKARINIALLLTWREIARRKNSAACNLLILDEVFSSALDIDGTGNLMELLNSSNGGKHKSNIVVISHTIPDVSSDRDRFDEIIRVTKVNNFSQYTYEYSGGE